MISPQSLTRLSSRRPWLTVGAWVVALVTAVALSGMLLGDALTTQMSFTNEPEAQRAEALIEDRLRGAEQNLEMVVVRSRSRSTVDAAAFRGYVEQVQQDVASLGPGVVHGALSFYDTGEELLVSDDRGATLVAAVMAGDDETAHENIPALRAVVDRHQSPAFETRLFGEHSIGWEFDHVAEDDLAKAEMFGVLAALVILLVVFGAVVAGVVPILMGLASIVLAYGAVAVVGRVFSFSFFVQNMIVMMGLALGIDYSLFVISRYREERARGRDELAAIEATGRTASRAVAFSGMTVVLALIGMLIVPMTIFRSLAGGAIFVAIASILAALTLLPALLALLGDRVNALRVLRHKGGPQVRTGGIWNRTAHAVMRRPATSVLLSAGALTVAAIPYLDINLGFPGVSTLPEDTDARRAFAIMAEDFSGGLDSPVEIAVDADVTSQDVRAGIEQLRADLAGDSAFGPSQIEANDAGDLAVVSVPTAGDPASDAALDAVDRVRETYVHEAFSGTDAEVLVGGDTAWEKDGLDVIDRYMPIVFALVLGMSFLLLTVVFRSIVVALKAILMNLLSVGAAYGLLVLVFQQGVGAGVLGFRQAEAIADWIPLFLFSVLFGLSMDYHVFLLTRIREQFDRTGDNAGAVAYGLRTTAGIITGAALIMVAVFAGFASGELVMFQQVGFGLGVAVLLDATIVRTVLVPASMKLLGTRNWYLPSWLRWLPELHTEDTSEPIARPSAPAGDPVAVAHGDEHGDGRAPGRRDLPGVLGLDDDAAADPGRSGHKAATLARLGRFGFPVPPGVVVSVDAVDRIRARGTVPDDLHDQLAVAHSGLGGGPVAVRSSGSAEDLPGASFAGQYETVLDVVGIDAVERAVMRCATSVRSARVTAYVAGRVASEGPAAPRMAILIQAMVGAHAAGVAFTADPVTGDRDEVLVSAARGLAERLVGGEATPEEWRVRRGEARRLSGPERVIDAEQAARVAALAADVETALGGPQDVEWAIAASGLSLVQARPITALPHPPRIAPPGEGFWEKDEDHYPTPLTPFGASVYLPAVGDGLAAMLDTWGLPVEAQLRSLGGEVYSRMVPLGAKERRPPPWWVVWVAMRAVPPLRQRARRIDRALRDRLPDRLIDGWSAARDGFRRDAAALRTVDLWRLTDPELLEHMDRVLALLRRGEAAHFELLPAYVIAVYELGKICEEVLGWTPAEALDLLAGTSEASSEPGRALRDLAAAMAASPGAVSALEGAGDDLVDRLRVEAPETAVLVESYLAEHGHRTFGYDPGDPTLAERPALVATLLRARIAAGGARPDRAAAARAAALARATAALRSARREQAERFHDALDAAERAYGTREDNVGWTDNVPSGLLRDTATEAGRRLVERGAIARADDAVFLQEPELRAALLDGSPDLRPLVDERRAERAWVTAHPGPHSYGRPTAQPGDLRGLPASLRYLSSAMAWYLGLTATPDGPGGEASALSGVAGSPGRHTGTVRVIHDESEFARLGPGDVLVCPITSPAWSVLFVQAGALVTDGGGLLAHAAVIAREYGVPAVLATGDATRRLHDGDTVTVDGTAGAVHATVGVTS